jgi:6-phosphofructokinase
MSWNDVAQIISLGGTVIGTARCASFRERAGRREAVRQMLLRGITSLVVIGGDGSLTGAALLQQEWCELVAEVALLEDFPDAANRFPCLNIAGLVGSIDNDLCGTDWTIGADTSLHRIVEAVDAIATSAVSHQRVFVIEVMGRRCGWLALMAAVACGADYCFLPEVPSTAGWEVALCRTVRHNRTLGRRLSLLIVSEGALDAAGNPIRAVDVQAACRNGLQLEARITVLGHLQRGGSPSAYDRILATLQGIEAVQIINEQVAERAFQHELITEERTGEKLEASIKTLVGVRENKVCRLNLAECVTHTRSLGAAMDAGDFSRVFSLRDPDFRDIYRTIYAPEIQQEDIYKINPNQLQESYSRKVDDLLESKLPLRIGILCVGAPAGGMNACMTGIVHACLRNGHSPVAIYGGIPTLITEDTDDGIQRKGHEETLEEKEIQHIWNLAEHQGNPDGNIQVKKKDCIKRAFDNRWVPQGVRPLTWLDVDGWVAQGGCLLGTHRSVPTPSQLPYLIGALRKHRLDAVILLGGYEAYRAARVLSVALPEFPLVAIPATVSNNVPGTEVSLGVDTALNIITSSCDILRMSAASTKRVFCVEVQGGNCGFLAQFGALATSATTAYIPEHGVSLADITRDLNHLKSRFADDRKDGRILLVNERASSVFNAEAIAKILQQEGKPLFDARSCKLGHLQQGGAPSPRDRILGMRYGNMAVDYIMAHLKMKMKPKKNDYMTDSYASVPKASSSFDAASLETPSHAAVLVGILNGAITFSNVHALQGDDETRTSKHPWFLAYRPYAQMLAKYPDIVI